MARMQAQWLLPKRPGSEGDNPGKHIGDMGKGPCNGRPGAQTHTLRLRSMPWALNMYFFVNSF